MDKGGQVESSNYTALSPATSGHDNRIQHSHSVMTQ